MELDKIVDPDADDLGSYFGDTIFVLATATATQRARAFVRMIKASND